MAILTGFPPSNSLSPGVYFQENDLSFVAPEQSLHRAGIVGFASKGPVGIPTPVATTRELHVVFGFPHPDVSDPYLVYGGEQFLLVANELVVVRVAEEEAVNDEAAQIADFDVPSAGGRIIIQSNTAGPYSFSKDSFFRWRLNGILGSKTLVVLADENRPGDDANHAYTCDELVDMLNSQLDATQDGFQFSCSTDEKIAVSTTYAFGPDASFELVSVKDSIYGGTVGVDNVTGLGTGMSTASTTGTKDRYPNDGYHTAGTWTFTGLDDAAADLYVVVDGTDSVLIDNSVQVISLADLIGTTVSTSDIVDEINNQITAGTIAGGFVAAATGDNLTLSTLHTGRDARILVKSSSPGFSLFGFSGLTASGGSPQGSSGDVAIASYGIVNGNDNTSGAITFTLSAESPGIEGNNTQVTIVNDTRSATFTMEVLNSGVVVETWGGLTKDQTSRYYVETYLAQVSDYIRVDDNVDMTAPPADGTYTLTGGTDGIPSDPDQQDALLIGSDIGAGTGVYALSQPEEFDIDLLAIPGHSSTSVIMALIDVCQNKRQDCLAIVDPPFGLTVNEVVDWQNGTHPLNSTRFDSDFAALYWPWVKIRDTHNRVDVWVPPSGSIMAVIARNDFLGAPWTAPAGANRGIVPGITDVFSRPSLSERNLMYGNRNAINPIIQTAADEGFTVWGQKTLQRRPTALDRVNVRRLMFTVEKRIRTACRQLLFEPHDEIFTQKFIDICTSILREIQVGRGIRDFIIDASAELNTNDVIDRNEFRARIGIIPVHAVEFIFIEFSVQRTGSINESSATVF